MTRAAWAAALLAAMLAGPAAAQDAARGAALAEARGCAACHGAGGRSETPRVPSLAAQQADFTALQMILFREGIRQVPEMTAAAAGLTDREVADLAAHYAALPPAPAERAARDAARAEQGARLAATRHCTSCHLPDWTGQSNVPRVLGQREDFLAMTLVAYRDGLRVGADTLMNGTLHGMSDADLAAIAHYLAQKE